MIMRGPYSRTATRRADRFKIGKTPRPQPGRLNDKIRRCSGTPRLAAMCGRSPYGTACINMQRAANVWSMPMTVGTLTTLHAG
jgi:hypothetical protein